MLVLAGTIPFLSKQLSGANFGLDGGDLVTAALVRGVAHPSGYPTYLLLLQPFLALPWETPYWRASLFSACTAALAAALVVKICIGNNRRASEMGAGTLGALALVGAPLFASQAGIAEVNALNVVFVLAMLAWAREASLRQTHPARLFFLSLAGGAGLGNHLTAAFSIPVVLAAIFNELIASRGSAARFWIQTAGFFSGLGVYLYLPLSAVNFPAINWGNPQTVEGFWWIFSGTPYQGLLFSIQPAVFINRLLLLLRMAFEQFTPAGFGLALVGITEIEKSWRWKTAWIFVIFALFAAGYNTRDSAVYLLPAWAMVAIWIGTGAIRLVKWRWKGGFPAGKVLVALTAAWLALHAFETLPRIDPRRDAATEKYLTAISELPPDAIFLTGGDAETFPAWYLILGLQQRPDLIVVSLPLTRYAWYQETLTRQYPELQTPPVKSWTAGSSLWGEDLLRLNPGKTACRTSVSGDPPGSISIRCGDENRFSGDIFRDEGWR